MNVLTAEHVTMPTQLPLPLLLGRAEKVARLRDIAREIRIQDVKLVHYAGAGHIGGDFSAIDILTTLYGAVLDVSPERVEDPERDRFILSKGHVAGALYTTLAAFGFLPVEQLSTFLHPLSSLNGHPNRRKVPGVEAARLAIRFLKAVHRALDNLDHDALTAAQSSHDALAAQRLVQNALLTSMVDQDVDR